MVTASGDKWVARVVHATRQWPVTAEVLRKHEQAPPIKPSRVDRNIVLRQLRRDSCEHIAELRTGRLVFFGQPKTFSTLPLDALKPSDQRHEGRYLLCRTIAEPVLTDRLVFAVEDQDGRPELLYMYNYPLYGTEADDIKHLFPPGTGFLIREPLLVAPFNPGILTHVRVTSASDVFVYAGDAPRLREVEWATSSAFRLRDHVPTPVVKGATPNQIKGAAYLSAGKPHLAAKYFSGALATAETQDDTVAAALSRGKSSIAAGRPASGFRDGNFIDMYFDMTTEKGRAGRGRAAMLRATALAEMRLQQRAADEAELASELLNSNELDLSGDALEDEIAALRSTMQAAAGKSEEEDRARDRGAALFVKRDVDAARERLRQQETGHYPWAKLEAYASKNGPFAHLDVGDFVGPVRVAQLKKRKGGRGVIATRDIEPGELLLVEKAFALSRGHFFPALGYDLNTELYTPAAHQELITEVVARVLDDPSTLTVLESLYDGHTPPKNPLVFGAVQQRSVPEFSTAPVDLDVRCVEEICCTNGLNLMRNAASQRTEQGAWSGLFINGSAFNHSCVANAYWKVIGDTLVVRARTQIKKGKEVYLSYVPLAGMSRLMTGDCIERHFGYNGCPCTLCAEDRRDEPGDRDARCDRLAHDFAEIVGRSDRLTEEDGWAGEHKYRSTQLYAIEDTYVRDTGPLRPALIHPYCAMIELARHADMGDLDEPSFSWLEYLISAAGGEVAESKTSPIRWRFTTMPVGAPEAVLRATLYVAHHIAISEEDDKREMVLKHLTLAADLSRSFWRRLEGTIKGSDVKEYKKDFVALMQS